MQVQDEAAGLVVAALDPQPGELVLDCCAAPGGKALFAAARMQGQVWATWLLLGDLGSVGLFWVCSIHEPSDMAATFLAVRLGWCGRQHASQSHADDSAMVPACCQGTANDKQAQTPA